eukprot:4606728-Amphidinium_carterae.2
MSVETKAVSLLQQAKVGQGTLKCTLSHVPLSVLATACARRCSCHCPPNSGGSIHRASNCASNSCLHQN